MDGKRPKHPCTPTCADRSPTCHSAECPHGWLDYEAEVKKLDKEKLRDMKSRMDFDASKELSIRRMKTAQVSGTLQYGRKTRWKYR